jgi:hypothetical protein
MSEDAVASVQAAEIQRLRAENGDLAALLRTQGVEMLDMRDRVRALEAEIAVLRGTLARPDTTDDGPVTLIEGTPNAPPHNE